MVTRGMVADFLLVIGIVIMAGVSWAEGNTAADPHTGLRARPIADIRILHGTGTPGWEGSWACRPQGNHL